MIYPVAMSKANITSTCLPMEKQKTICSLAKGSNLRYILDKGLEVGFDMLCATQVEQHSNHLKI